MHGEITLSLEREPDALRSRYDRRRPASHHHCARPRHGPAGRHGQPIGLQRISQRKGLPAWISQPASGRSRVSGTHWPAVAGIPVDTIAADRTTICRSISPPSSPTITPRGGCSAPGSGHAGVSGARAVHHAGPAAMAASKDEVVQRVRGSSAVRGERFEDIAACLERNRARFSSLPAGRLVSCCRPSAVGARAPRLPHRVRRRSGDWLPRAVGPEQLQADRRPQLRPGHAALAVDGRDLGSRYSGHHDCRAPGRPIPHVFVSHVAVDDDNVDVFSALLARAYDDARERRHACLVAGFAEQHPFLADHPSASPCLELLEHHLRGVLGRREAAVDGAIDRRVPHLEVGLL